MERPTFGLDDALYGGLDGTVSIGRFRSRTDIGTVRSPGTARKLQTRLPGSVPASIWTIPSPYSTKQCRQICKSFRIRGVRKCRPLGAQAQSATHARDFHGRTIRSGTVSRLPKKCRRGVVSGLCRDFQLVSAFAHGFNRIDPTAAEMAGSGVFHFVEASKVDSGPIPAPVPALTTTHKRRNAI